MNWTRGLFRLWLLVSLTATGFIGWDQYEWAYASCNWRIAKSAGSDPFDACGRYYIGAALDAVVPSVAASLALFFIGAALVWGVRGFQRKDA